MSVGQSRSFHPVSHHSLGPVNLTHQSVSHISQNLAINADTNNCGPMILLNTRAPILSETGTQQMNNRNIITPRQTLSHLQSPCHQTLSHVQSTCNQTLSHVQSTCNQELSRLSNPLPDRFPTPLNSQHITFSNMSINSPRTYSHVPPNSPHQSTSNNTPHSTNRSYISIPISPHVTSTSLNLPNRTIHVNNSTNHPDSQNFNNSRVGMPLVLPKPQHIQNNCQSMILNQQYQQVHAQSHHHLQDRQTLQIFRLQDQVH
eukprot:GHVL01017557.1.p1 GENE.GHVL01017557.1~~GHVL01017557.1.p1  ORF type:complete len:259 (-),score=11.06 GHVL01017557.1:220-996(-)